MKSYIQPFERELAFRELEKLSGFLPLDRRPNGLEYVIQTTVNPKILADSLAYWETITSDSASYTRQVIYEASTEPGPRNQVFQGASVSLPRRRVLRYGTHGIHEYRGKFFPQLVRSLVNWDGVPVTGTVLDPMCGSGTALVESAVMGRRSVGMDLNPLSVLITETKCRLLGASSDQLERLFFEVEKRLANGSVRDEGEQRLSHLTDRDKEYLRSWFGTSVLTDVCAILVLIRNERNELARNFLTVALSNILRSVSWQKEDDLRVRKQEKEEQHLDTIGKFLSELLKSVQVVSAFLKERGSSPVGAWTVMAGDARHCRAILKEFDSAVDAVITSPPYATALPYIDTDRLSLTMLGLLPRAQHRPLEQEMIGNREITDKRRHELWALYQRERNNFPDDVSRLIDRIHRLVTQTPVGFRRKNMPALLSKYFSDMRQVFCGIHHLLKPGHRAYVVIGNNSTTIDEERIEIRTATLLASVAEAVGFRLADRLDMDMLVSRDIFRANAMSSEDILVLEKI